MAEHEQRKGMDVLGKVASGLYIMTCRGAEQNHGLLLSWVTQAGFEPPAISLAVKQDRPVVRDLKPGLLFGINLLAADDTESKTLLGHFAKGFPIGEDAFVGQELGQGEAGAPYLEKALGYLECRLLRVLEPSTEHNIVIGEVVGGRMLKEGSPWIHLRASGTSY